MTYLANQHSSRVSHRTVPDCLLSWKQSLERPLSQERAAGLLGTGRNVVQAFAVVTLHQQIIIISARFGSIRCLEFGYCPVRLAWCAFNLIQSSFFCSVCLSWLQAKLPSTFKKPHGMFNQFLIKNTTSTYKITPETYIFHPQIRKILPKF